MLQQPSKLLVSIIMPAYNAAAYIAEAIDSVIAQTHAHWELLVVDDGSQDDTATIVRSFTDARIRYFYQENQGVSAARNLALAQMQGDYFCFLDADDIMPTKSLEARLAVFAQHPNWSFVDGQVHRMDKDMQQVVSVYTPMLLGENPFSDLVRIGGKSFGLPCWMIRREQGRNYQLNMAITHGEDMLFYIDLAKEGGLYGYTQEVVLLYRTGISSAMSNLKALEKGYRDVYREIALLPEVQQDDLRVFRQKARSIMAKSFLKRRQPLQALRSWWSFS